MEVGISYPGGWGATWGWLLLYVVFCVVIVIQYVVIRYLHSVTPHLGVI